MHWDALFEVVSEGGSYTIKAGLVVEALIAVLVVIAIIVFYRRTSLELESVEVELPFLGIKTAWKPDMAERIAAWKIYIELLTRISLQPLKPEEGVIREALDSLYKLFQNMRVILEEGGPGVGLTEDTIGYITVKLMNERLRPFLAEWHPRLQEWESKNTSGIGKQAYEKQWVREAELRQATEALRRDLEVTARQYAKVARIKPKKSNPLSRLWQTMLRVSKLRVSEDGGRPKPSVE